MSIAERFNTLIDGLDVTITESDKNRIKEFIKAEMKPKQQNLLPDEPTTEDIMKKLNSIEY